MHSTSPLTRRRVSLSLTLIGALLALIVAQFTLFAPARPTQAAQAGSPAAALPRIAPHIPSTSLVISQVYGGGGNLSGTVPFCNDFIELFNVSTVVQSTAGLSVQYGPAASNFSQVYALPTAAVPAGGYYLVQVGSTGVGCAPISPAPDTVGPTMFNLSATNGKVALANITTALPCGAAATRCWPTNPNVIDLVGYGSAADYEGAAAVPVLTNASSATRNGNGCLDSDNNSTDFTVTTTIVPRNSGTQARPCVGGTATVPPTAGGSTATTTQTSVSSTATATGVGSTATATTTATGGGVRIHDIQGAAHISPLNGQAVSNVPGIVTVRRSNGFNMQDPNPDANIATSEAIFVFTGSAPTVNVGDSVQVSGTVAEFRAGGASGLNNLTSTEITGPTIAVVSTGNTLPTPVVIGIGGRMPPTEIIEDDATGNVETSGVFDPATDGIDFYESLEGMLVQVNNAVATGHTLTFGTTNLSYELTVLGDLGVNASVRTNRGGIVIRPTAVAPDQTDFNPERITLANGLLTSLPAVNVNDTFPGAIVGYMDYNFGNFKLAVTQALPPVVPGGLTKEQTTPQAANQIAIGAFNVQNLSPLDPQSKFDGLAGLVVNNLKAPDIISVEEIQDNSGPADDGTVAADQTWGLLITAITRAGGPTYQYREIDPVNDQDGGQPGGNIRVGFLFRVDRGVAFIDRPGGDPTTAVSVLNVGGSPQLSFSPGRIQPQDPAWNASRKPLAAEFTYNGRKLFLVANHFRSKGGDDALFGKDQPPVRSSETQRHPQAQLVNNFVTSIQAIDPNANIVVLGDLNDFQFSQTLVILKGSNALTDLIDTLPLPEQYTYVFEGNSQAIDHILVSVAMSNTVPITEDVVHVNSEFAVQDSDHEPQVARFTLPQLTATPTGTVATTTTATAAVPTATVTATSILPTITITVLPPTVTATRTNTVTPTQTVVLTPTCPPGIGNSPLCATQGPTNTPPPTTVPPTVTLTVVPPSVTQSATSQPATQTATSQPAATQTATSVPSATRTAVATATPCPIRFSDVTDPSAYYYTGVYYLACHGVISGYNDGTFKPFNNTTRAQMTKIVTLAFNIALVTPPATGTFADVDQTSVFYQLIETAAAHGIVSGYSCGGVDPQTGQSEPCDSTRRPYFRPSDFVTRGQLTKIVVIGAGFPLRNPPTPTFTDVAPSNVFYPFIETAVCHGVISGYSDQTFRPNNFAFRGQIAKIVYLAVTNPASTCPSAAIR